jgi:hypothetical protein
MSLADHSWPARIRYGTESSATLPQTAPRGAQLRSTACPISKAMPDPATIVELRRGPHAAALPISGVKGSVSSYLDSRWIFGEPDHVEHAASEGT